MAKSVKSRVATDVASVMAWLEAHCNQKIRNEMGPRYGIFTDNAIGVRMADMIALAKAIGRNHALALQLWATGNYEARTVAAMIDDPAQVTAAQMDRWAKDFDNWAICDTVCFKLFDRTNHAPAKIKQWTTKRPEFVRRAGFALLACMALHFKDAPDALFADGLKRIEAAATDDRNFVRKAVSWALRSIGRRPKCKAAAKATAQRLAESDNPTARWIGKDALKAIK